MPKHLAATTQPFLIPSHYLTANTRDYPLALLDTSGAFEDSDLPVAYGLVLLYDAQHQALATEALRQVAGHVCGACSEAVAPENGAALETEASGGGNPVYLDAYHVTCLLAMDVYGIIPTSQLEWVEA